MRVTKTNKKLFLIFLAVSAAAVFAIFVLALKKQSETSTQPQIIKGEVADMSSGCNVDGICSVTLDNDKKIITGCGLMPGGKTCKRYNQSKLRIGQRIEATVMHQDAKTYNLECDSCTIRVLD
jgi:hypothetical protein